jgi:DNA-binding CsgD family transcriptional regulator
VVEELRSADLRAVLRGARVLGDVKSSAQFPATVLEVMAGLVAAEVPSYNEVDLSTQTIVAVAPGKALFPRAEELVGHFLHQHPTVSYFARTADGSAHKFSDFVSAAALHRLDLYDLVYRRLGLEHLISIVVHRRRGGSLSNTQLRLSFGRGSSDFSERDRAVLNAMRPFVEQARYALDEIDELRATIGRLDRAALVDDRMIVVVGPGGRVDDASAPAAALLAWLGRGSSRDLPEPLRSWATAQHSGDRGPEPLSFNGPEGVLTARLLRARAGDPNVITLEPARGETTLGALLALGLSQREALVLQAVARGQSNRQAARELGIGERTVAKHLQNVYVKLGVTNRTAAVRAARVGAVRGRPVP